MSVRPHTRHREYCPKKNAVSVLPPHGAAFFLVGGRLSAVDLTARTRRSAIRMGCHQT